MANTKLLTFSIYKAEISANADTNTPAAWTEIPLSAEGTGEYTIQKAEVQDGEGALQHTWKHTQRARFMLRTKLALFRILEIATGSPVSSTTGGDMIYVGREEEISAPFVRLRLHQRAVDFDTKTEGYAEVIVFKAQAEMPGVQMREVTPGEYTINFDALKASYDASGNSIPGAYFSFRGLKSNVN